MTDAERLRRLDEATGRAGRPSPEQRQAVEEAARRVAAAFGPLPAYRICWNPRPMRALGSREPINACVHLVPGGQSLIVLPMTASPAALLRSTVHELLHVVHGHVVPDASRADRELIAEELTERLVPEVSREAA